MKTSTLILIPIQEYTDSTLGSATFIDKSLVVFVVLLFFFSSFLLSLHTTEKGYHFYNHEQLPCREKNSNNNNNNKNADALSEF